MLSDQYRDKLAHIGRRQIIDIFFDDPNIRSVSLHFGWYKFEFIDGSTLIVKGKELELMQ
jgi:hypothetical protein